MVSTTPPSIVPSAAAAPVFNLGINIGLFLIGTLIGLCLVYFGRKAIRRLTWDNFPHALVILDGVIVVLGTIVTSSLELWRVPVLTGISIYAGSGYLLMGVLASSGIGSKWLLSLAKEISGTRIKDLEASERKAAKERDIALSAEALIGEVMRAKLSRLAERRRTGQGALAEALAPEKQIHVLIQVLHRHFAKRLAPNHRLRIGIYMPGMDGKTLEAAFSWDGGETHCFSNRHQGFMKLTNPGGGRSVVVECWLAADPFIFIADGEVSQQQGKFRYFYSGQEKELRSMVAYRHNLTELSAEDAFVMSLDSNQADFFSADIESECRLLLPAFSRRIELELLALPITPIAQSSAPL